MQHPLLTSRGAPRLESSPHLADLLRGYDEMIRGRLAAALAEGRVTAHGLTVLRDHYGLTPAETNVFVEYYLSHSGSAAGAAEPKRRSLARDLNLSENTLMHHITSIRRKLGLISRAGSANVFVWCVMAGITNLPPAHYVAELELTG